MKLEKRFYLLESLVRHYAWGMRSHGDVQPYIASLLGHSSDSDTPWAELWIGAHPSLPSRVVGEEDARIPLNEVISENMADALGAVPAGSAADGLPFLLKVLSCEKALSIQSHPDKKNAERLHEKDPKHYPDDNHKPEVMIGMTAFDALAGFRDLEDAVRLIGSHESLSEWLEIAENAESLSMRVLCDTLLSMPAAIIRRMLADLNCELREHEGELSEVDRLCLDLQNLYPMDRGCLFAFLLNYLRMQPGEALYIPANEPHAYLNGTGIECMANSDNVIRAGLTPKFIDSQELMGTLAFGDWRGTLSHPIETAEGEKVYETPAREFQVSFLEGKKTLDLANRRKVATVFLVLEGNVVFTDGEGNKQTATRGTTWFRPAFLTKGRIEAKTVGTRLVIAEVGKL